MSPYPYEQPVDPAVAGMDQARLDRVAADFTRQQTAGVFPGGQMVLRRNGRLVLNEVCGIGRGLRPEEEIPKVNVRPDTPFPVLSAGKPIAAIAIALLEDRGELEVETPVAAIIPGFSRHGKDEITILDVLTHRTGILLPGLVARPDLWGDREAILTVLVEAEPVYPRGTIAYAAYEYGWLLSEIVRRVDGRQLSEFVIDEFSVPLELTALQYGLGSRELGSLAYNYWLGKNRVMVSGVNVAENFEERNNSIEQINSLNPAVSMVTDAASLAAFYEFLLRGGVSSSGEQVISEKSIRKYTTRNVSGLDRSSKLSSNLGRGFMLGAGFISAYGWWGTGSCFGHAGGFSSLAFGDYKTNVAVAIVTNGHRSFFDLAKRFIPLAHKLRRACF